VQPPARFFAMTKALFELRKFLPILFMPLGLSLALIGIGLLRRRRAAILAGLLVVFLASLPAVSDSLCFLLESRYRHLPVAQCPAADVVVPLNGFAGVKKRYPGKIQWYAAAGRFEAAVQLVRMQKAPILLFTGARPLLEDWHPEMDELLRQAAIEHGVPANAVRFTRPSATTSEEAGAVADYLRRNGGRRVILVTSAIHMPRAALLFRRAGIAFVPFPVDYQSDGWQWKWANLLPSSQALAHTDQGLHELYGDLFCRAGFR